MTPLFHILPATQEDVTDIVNLVNSAYRGNAARKGWTHEADLISGTERIDEESIHSIIISPSSVILKCLKEDQTLVGSVYLEVQKKNLYLGMLSVSPQIQAQGIGKQLLRAAEDYAKTHSCERIIMTVISVREELINWYIRNGFAETGERQPFPDDGRFGLPIKPLEFVVLEKVIV